MKLQTAIKNGLIAYVCIMAFSACTNNVFKKKVSNTPANAVVEKPAYQPKGTKLSGYTVYFGANGNGGMITRQSPAYWDADTKTASWDSIRFGGYVECRDGRVYQEGKLVSDPVSCEFDKISPVKQPGVPPQVFVNEFDYGKIAQGKQSVGGTLQEKVIVD